MEAGSLCWIELATPNPAQALTFYHALFGWGTQQPSDARHMYTLLARAGAVAAGLFQLPEPLRQKNVPPHWLLYVATPNADGCTRRAQDLGATIVREPFTAQDLGRMAVIQDPTGAVFAVWQALRFAGFAAQGENAFDWGELITGDADRAGEFYSELFGWRIKRNQRGYRQFSNGAQGIGGIPPAAERNAQAPPHWLTWFQVADCDASVGAAVASGATILMRPTTVEQVGRISVMQDPQGAELALITPASRS